MITAHDLWGGCRARGFWSPVSCGGRDPTFLLDHSSCCALIKKLFALLKYIGCSVFHDFTNSNHCFWSFRSFCTNFCWDYWRFLVVEGRESMWQSVDIGPALVFPSSASVASHSSPTQTLGQRGENVDGQLCSPLLPSPVDSSQQVSLGGWHLVAGNVRPSSISRWASAIDLNAKPCH